MKSSNFIIDAMSVIITAFILFLGYMAYTFIIEPRISNIIDKAKIKPAISADYKLRNIITPDGLKCKRFVFDDHTIFITCNWGGYNHSTHYGEYPFAIEKEPDGNNNQKSNNEAD